MVDLEKLVGEMKQRLDAAYESAARRLEEAFAQAKVEREVLQQAQASYKDADGLIVQEINVMARLQPGGTDPVRLFAQLTAGNGYFTSGVDVVRSDHAQLGEQLLAPGKYRAVVLFFKRE